MVDGRRDLEKAQMKQKYDKAALKMVLKYPRNLKLKINLSSKKKERPQHRQLSKYQNHSEEVRHTTIFREEVFLY